MHQISYLQSEMKKDTHRARSHEQFSPLLGHVLQNAWDMPALRTRALIFRTGPSNVCLGVALMIGDDECLGAVAFKSLLRKFAALDPCLAEAKTLYHVIVELIMQEYFPSSPLPLTSDPQSYTTTREHMRP